MATVERMGGPMHSRAFTTERDAVLFVMSDIQGKEPDGDSDGGLSDDLFTDSRWKDIPKRILSGVKVSAAQKVVHALRERAHNFNGSFESASLRSYNYKRIAREHVNTFLDRYKQGLGMTITEFEEYVKNPLLGNAPIVVKKPATTDGLMMHPMPGEFHDWRLPPQVRAAGMTLLAAMAVMTFWQGGDSAGNALKRNQGRLHAELLFEPQTPAGVMRVEMAAADRALRAFSSEPQQNSAESRTRIADRFSAVLNSSRQLVESKINSAKALMSSVPTLEQKVRVAIADMQVGREGVVPISAAEAGVPAQSVAETPPFSVSAHDGNGAIWAVGEIAKHLIAENNAAAYPEGSHAYRLLEEFAVRGNFRGAIIDIGNGFGNRIAEGTEFVLLNGDIVAQAGHA